MEACHADGHRDDMKSTAVTETELLQRVFEDIGEHHGFVHDDASGGYTASLGDWASAGGVFAAEPLPRDDALACPAGFVPARPHVDGKVALSTMGLLCTVCRMCASWACIPCSP